MNNFILKGIISAGYAGYFPVIKGTMGSFVALIIYLVLFYCVDIPYKVYLISGAGTVIFTVFCLWLGKWAENYYQEKDPSHFVLDEVAGFFIAVFAVDISMEPVKILLFIFVINRLFDIIKPFPANKAEKLPGGLGIVTDDLIAGVYTNILFQIISRVPGFYRT